jgi:histidinol dehydrogenase
MIQLDASHSGFAEQLRQLLDRSEDANQQIEDTVRQIIEAVRDRGDEALLEYTRRFDQLAVETATKLELEGLQSDSIAATVPDSVARAIDHAAQRIRDYHSQEVSTSWQIKETDGTILGQKITPLDQVGIYVPGGKASYPSTAIPARVAGVSKVIMAVPTPNGEINPAIIYAAKIAGVDRIFTIGGAQAIAGLAYGTETIPAVNKIVGPGNIWVATAKKMVFGKVGIDMIAGPSEVVVVCDSSVDPDWVAMDLFAQAEHDERAQSIAITDSWEMAKAVQSSIDKLLPQMERRSTIESALDSQGAIIVTESLAKAVDVSNRIAPEHLELLVAEPETLIDLVFNAGAIFVGRYSAESLGDYCAGPNHVLPTAGTARFSSPLGVYDFQKRSSLIQASPAGANKMAQTASVLARCEGLTAHARSAEFPLGIQEDGVGDE